MNVHRSPTSDALRVLKQLQSHDHRLVGPLRRRRFGHRTPPTNDLIGVDKAGNTFMAAGGVTDGDLLELSHHNLISSGAEDVALTDRGRNYVTSERWGRSVAEKNLVWQRTAAVVAVIGLPFIVWQAIVAWRSFDSGGSNESAATLAEAGTDVAVDPASASADPAPLVPTTSIVTPATTASVTTALAVTGSSADPLMAEPSTTTIYKAASGRPATLLEYPRFQAPDAVRTSIDQPGPGTQTRAFPTFQGSADHSSGISHIEAVLLHTGRNVFWNPDERVWQQRSRRFSLAVGPVESGDFLWTWTPVGPLPPGHYQFRVWAKSLDGQGDTVGPAVNVAVTDDPGLTAGQLDEAVDLLDNAVASAEYEVEQANPTHPQVKVRAPVNGARVRTPVRVKIIGHSTGATTISSVKIALRDETGGWWDMERLRWSADEQWWALPLPGDARPDTEHEFYLDESVTPPGRYTISARIVDSDDRASPLGRTNEFEVFAP